MTKTNNITIMAAGTGGHVFPALAIAQELINSGFTITWLGSKHGIENRVVKNPQINLIQLPVIGLRGKNFFKIFLSGFKLIYAFLVCLGVLIFKRPKVVLGMGGYVCGPGGVASWLLRIPLVVHEQNQIPGLTNKILAKFANKVLTGFPDSFPKSNKIIYTGNPVRADILALAEPEIRFKNHEANTINLLVLGGSQGAKAINDVLPATITELEDKFNFKIWHQTGSHSFASTKDLYSRRNISAKVEEFITDMAKAYAWADLVIARSGALTVAEIAAVGLPCVFIPYPYAVDDHQSFNARFLQKKGVAKILPEDKLNCGNLAACIEDFCESKDKLKELANKCRDIAVRDSAQQIIFQLEAYNLSKKLEI